MKCFSDCPNVPEVERLTRELAAAREGQTINAQDREKWAKAAYIAEKELAKLRGLIEKACSSVLISPDLAEWLREEAAKGIK